MLYATVRNRKIHVKKPDTVVQNGVKVDWLQMEMDDEWAEMESIVCVFVARYTEEQTGDGGTKTLVEQEITKEMLHTFGQKVLVPWECLGHSGMLSVSCTGYVGSEKIMTTMYPDSFWQIVQNGPVSGDSSIEPTPSLYDQIVAAAGTANAAAMAANHAKDQLLQDKANGVFDGKDGKAATVEVGTVVTGSPEENAHVYATGTPQEVRLNFVLPRGKQGPKGEVNPSEIAQAIKDYMAAHPIQETDPTVPDWAKRPEKPTYTASEVGALPDTYTPPVDASLSETSTNPVQNKVVAAKLSEVESIAKGRATGHVFETETDMRTWIAANASALTLGDNLYIRATDVPDYWWDGTSAQPLETQKVDLTEYAKKSEVPAVDTTLTQPGQAADAAEVGARLSSLSEEIANGVSWNKLKDKPFYLEKTLVVELTKDDFTVNDQDGRFKYMYRSTPKLDWFTSAESIAFEIEIVDTNGRRYTATQDSIDVFFGNDNTYDDGREFWYCYSDLFDIISGVDLDLYDDEYYYKDEWGVLVQYGGIEFSGINIKIYRVDVKKIPEICLDAAIGKTAITVGSVLEDSEAEMSPSAIVPDLRIPISPSGTGEEIYCNRISNRLRISGYLFPYNGDINYTFQKVIPTTVGSSISFDISSEGDTLWDKIGWYSPWKYGRYLDFRLESSYSGGGAIEFLAHGNLGSNRSSAVASSNLGNLYIVVFEYTNSYKTLNVTIKCVV